MFIEKFEINNGKLYKYNGDDEIVIVPEGVTSIGFQAFKQVAMREIIFPAGLVNMDIGAINSCQHLEKISFSGPCEKFTDHQITHCENLKEVEYPNGMTEIQSTAFPFCPSIRTIKIPKTVQKIRSDCRFGNLLGKYVIDPENPYLCMERNMLMSKDKKIFFGCNLLTGGVLEIPDSVEEVYNFSNFALCEKLKKVIIPKSVKKIYDYDRIGLIIPMPVEIDSENSYYTLKDNVLYSKDMSVLYKALRYCDISTFKIPETVKIIGETAFAASDYSPLVSISLPENLEKIEHSAFLLCNNLKTITLPKSVNYIGSNAFASCSKLGNLTFWGKIETIDTGAFAYCKKIKEVVFLDDVRKIESAAFIGCLDLRSVIFKKNRPKIDKTAFSQCSKHLILN